ncbi:cytochrome P450 [Amycolatopsis rhabdoformis]|uniref:Cytochrome P450 n=1 Tax=Amycolatopsis rhabdoformis TaxID=1448059 RepID=A0ABZ1IKG9_9PSEU|nr:cytochrome P450 [Amycolatopsis rhabdoformis]WSE34708.1 cytochrome P450 [Amycolatopsis rhabdoformis]
MTRSTVPPAEVPTTDVDLYSDDQIREPYETYRALRDAGPVVYLEKYDTWAVSRYEHVREVLKDTDTFSSAGGVSVNEPFNRQLVGTTLASDPPEHDKLRGIVAGSLTPRALGDRRAAIEEQAEQLVAGLVARGEFDAVTELARVLPLSVVPDFIGLPQDGRDRLLDWASAVFDAIGPMNERAQRGLPALAQLGSYIGDLVEHGTVTPGSLGDGVLSAAREGRIPTGQCPALMLDYLGPALDTTISAIGNAIYLFSRYTEQWDKVREDPKLIPNAFNEVVRLETPIRGFCRHTTKETSIGGTTIGAGQKVLVLYAAANRDERKWQDPETFDVTRRVGDHVGFGFGVHGCAGQGLARIEAHALLKSLAARVASFELLGSERALNNVIRAFASIRVRVTPIGA